MVSNAETWLKRETQAKLLKEVLLSLAVLIAGGWAVYRFIVIDSYSARQQFEESLALTKAMGLQIDLNAQAERTKKTRYVRGLITIRNIGVKTVDIKVVNSPLIWVRLKSIGKVLVPDRTTLVWQRFYRADGHRLIGLRLVPGRTVTSPFVFPVNDPGYYLIQFQAGVQQTGTTTARLDPWSSRTIVRVAN